MQVGVVDLGGLGAHMVRRLLAGGHQCVVFDKSPRLVAELAAERAYGAASLVDLAHELDAPRVIWLAGPACAADATIADLRSHLEPGDVIVDCADSDYVDDIFRATDLATAGIHYVDVGISGGLARPDEGCCLTVGGDERVVRQLEPILKQLTAHCSRASTDVAGGHPPQAYLHCGPPGAGHFVNMIHSGIERCLLAAYAEGFSILRAANVGRARFGARAEKLRAIELEHYQYDFDLAEIAEVWSHGSRVASPLLDLTARALAKLPGLRGSLGTNESPREEWPAMRAAVEEAIPVPVLASALYQTASGHERDFASRLLAAVQRECSDPARAVRTSGRYAGPLPELHS